MAAAGLFPLAVGVGVVYLAYRYSKKSKEKVKSLANQIPIIWRIYGRKALSVVGLSRRYGI